MDGDVPTTAAGGQQGRIGVGGLAAGFLVIGLLALAVAVLQAPGFASGMLDINVLAPFDGNLRVLPTAPIAAACLLGAAGLWKRRQFGKWAAWLIVIALGIAAAGLGLLGLISVLLTGSSFRGSQFEAGRTIGLGVACGLGAVGAVAAARAIARTVSHERGQFRPASVLDLAGVAVLLVAVAATTAGPAAVAPNPFLPYSSPAAAGQPTWKFGIGVTQVEIGSAPIPNAPSGDPQVARVLTSLAVHLELEPASDMPLVGPLRLCLRYDTSGNTGQPQCWGGGKLTKLVNTQVGAPAAADAPWVMTPATAATLDVTLARDPAACDYPPGPWLLEVYAQSPDKSLGQIYATARVDVPADGPQTTVGPKVSSEWLCMHMP